MNVLIYVIPALVDSVVAQMMFVSGIRLAQMGASDWIVSGVWSVWSLPYVLFCFATPRWLRDHNASIFLLASCALFVLVATLFTVLTGVKGIAVLTVLCALAAGLFFPAFQVFMKTASAKGARSLAHAIGLYTMAWSVGFALGPFVAGFIMETGPSGWKLSYLLSGLVALLAGIGIWVARQHGQPEADPAPLAAGSAPEPANTPDLAWLGWVSALVALSVIASIRSLLPAMAEKEMALSESRQGLIMCLISMAQAVTGLALCRSRTWMYRPSAILGFGIPGVLGVLGFAFARDLGWLCLSALLLGTYIGAFFFYLAYHSLVHATRSVRYVSMNEAVVGIAGFIAPAAAGILSERLHSYTWPHLAGAILLAGMIVFQMTMHGHHPLPAARRPSPHA